MRGFASMVAEIKERFGSAVHFRFIYIAEAHAMDEWPVRSGRFTKDGEPIVVNQPTSLPDRCALAQKFITDYHFDLETFVDIPESNDPFERAFAPWPLRFFLVDAEDRLQFVSEPVEGSSVEAFSILLKLLEAQMPA